MARLATTLSTVLNTYGDSISMGFNATSDPVSYSGIVGAAYGWSVTDNGLSGTQIQDQLVNNLSKIVSTLDQHMFITGYNDMRQMGTDSTKQATYQACLYASALYLATPHDQKVRSRDSTKITFTGTPTNSGILGGAFWKSLGISGTATFTVPGTILYIVCAKDNTATAGKTVQVSVDGVDKGTFNCNNGTVTQSGTIYSAFVIRIDSLSAGSHTVVLTAGTGGAWFGFATGNGYVKPAIAPPVYLGNCLSMTTTGYATGSAGFTNGSATAVAQFNTRIQDVVTILRDDGLTNVQYCDISSAYIPSTMVDTDHVHPTDAGHAAIGEKFLTYTTPEISRVTAGTRTVLTGDRFVPRDFTSDLFCNGTTSIVSITTVAAQNNLTAVTMAGWINIRGYGENGVGRIFSKGSGQSPRCRISTRALSVNAFEFVSQRTVGSSGNWRTDVNTILPYRWYFVAATSTDISNNAVVPVLYINGVSMPVTVVNAPTGTIDADTALAYIGNSSTSDRTFDGYLADIQFYNTALTAAQIAQLYYGQADYFSGLVGRWKLNEGSGSTAIDSTGNANGTIANATYGTNVPFAARSLVS